MLPDGRCMREFLPAYARVRDSGGRTTGGAPAALHLTDWITMSGDHLAAPSSEVHS